MILERLRVEGFRHLAAPYEFIPDERLTIISAPNGSGKSTLLDALYHGLLEKHTVSGAVATERFASRGRELIPRIGIDFRVGSARYRLRKQFLSAKLAKLERWESGRYVPLKEGSAADDFVRELFAADAPGRGALDAAKHWGLAHVLWSPSGVKYGALPPTAGDQVRAMLSDVATATLGERAVEDRVAQRYQRYFTDSGSLARSATSANLPAREAQIAVSKAAVVEAAAAVQRLHDLRRSHEDSDWEAQRLAAQRAEIRRRLEETRTLGVMFDDLTAQQQTCAGNAERWHERSSQCQHRIQAIGETRVRRNEIAAKRSTVQAEMDALSKRLEASSETLRNLNRAVDEAAAVSAQVQLRAAGITAAQTYVADLNDILRLRERIALTSADQQLIADLQERRAGVFAPTKDELTGLREAENECRNLEAKIAASALTLEIIADSAAQVEVLIADRPGTIHLPQGNAQTLTGLEQIVVVIPGFGRIKASGADSGAVARRKHAPLAARLNAAYERFGATSILELEARTDRAADLDSQIALRRSLAERRHGVEPTVDRQRLSVALARVEAIELANPEWPAAQPDAAALRNAFDIELRESADAQNAATRMLRAAQQPHAAICSALEIQRTSDGELAIAKRQYVFRLDDLEADGLDDAQREAQFRTNLLEWNTARAQREQFDLRLRAFAENPHHIRTLLEAQELEAGKQYEHSHGRAQRDLALLEEYAVRSSYSQWAQAEETLEARNMELRMEHAEAAAVRLLWSVFAEVRKARVEAVLAPVEAAASRYLARIAGSSLGPIHVTRDLTPLGVRHSPSGELVEIESTLSAGEREQIYLATRLALSDVIVGTRGRQLFVLDDILTATDPSRLRRFVMLLQELSRERLQIIITTADASRYLGIAGAKHIDLRAALSITTAA